MRNRSIAGCAALIAWRALFAAEALARPGGGGGYHGGGGGGGGGYHGGGGGSFGGGGFSFGSSSGGGGSASAFDVLILVVLVVIWLVFAARRRGLIDDGAFNAITAVQTRDTATIRAVTLDAIRARDPALTLESIEGRVRRMNDVLVSAWCAGDMRNARPFVSDGVYSRFHVQLGLMRGENRRNVMKEAQVIAVALVGVESAAPLDVVHVRVTARARDVEVTAKASEDEIAQALARADSGEYEEIWSLVRRHGALTTRDASALGSSCPSCGAAILDAQAGGLPTLGEMIKCRYCNALLCSGEHDWVLAEITQVVEWHPSTTTARGLTEVRARDAQLTRESLEDRASYLFWKWIEAARARSPAPLRKCATSELLEQRAHLDAMANARDIAVGGADLVLIEADDAWDRAYVKVFWSAIVGGSQHTSASSVLRLLRKHGVTTRPGLTALVCGSCGAPIGESDTPTCDHCSALLAAGDDAWVLDAIAPPGVLEGEAMRRARVGGLAGGAPGAGEEALPEWLVPRIADPRERRVLFAQMAAMIAVDGEVTRRERRLLEMAGRRWGIPREAIDAYVSGGAPSVAAVGSAQPEWFLAGLVAAALADGKIDARERVMLERACDGLGLAREELGRQIEGCRTRMDRESRGAGA